MINLELNEIEANALLNLIHAAVQARGLEAAEAGVVLSRKLTQAKEQSEGNKAEAKS